MPTTHSIEASEALNKALSRTESAAALGNQLLKDVFLEAATDEDFQREYFENFEGTNRSIFRARLRRNPVFQRSLSTYFQKDIEVQNKIGGGQTPALAMELAPTVNQDERRPQTITHVVLHHTVTRNARETLNGMASTGVSCHYMIDLDGALFCLVGDKYRAWHAGLCSWHGISNLNFCSIGIELVNTGFASFPEKQIDKLLALLKVLRARYRIHPYHFISHADIAPGRKIDPNIQFPWDRLDKYDLGLWLKEGEKQNKLPPNFSIPDALRQIGYQVTNLDNALKAFSLHYLKEIKTGLNEDDKLILHSLAEKAARQDLVGVPPAA